MLLNSTQGIPKIKELVRPFIPLGGRIVSVLQFPEQFRAALKRSS
jgi:hypothetical protein